MNEPDRQTAASTPLTLPPRGGRPPVTPSTSGVERVNEMAVECLAGVAAFVLGLLVYWLLATRQLDAFMFDLPSFSEMVGAWGSALAYGYASACCLVAAGLVRWLRRKPMGAGAAIAISTALALFFAVAVVLIVAAVLAALLAVFGLFALFFHSGSR